MARIFPAMLVEKPKHQQLLKIALLIVVTSMVHEISAAQCGRTRPCPDNLCCNMLGACATDKSSCGALCMSGPCRQTEATDSIHVKHIFENLVTPEMFDELFPARLRSFYTFESFLEAATAFPEFGTTGDLPTQKRELAAFFAHVKHETAGLSITEGSNNDKENDFCSLDLEDNKSYACVPGKKYFPRGAMQLTWNYNYGRASMVLDADLLLEPELVSEEAVMSFKTALWVWMTPRSSTAPSSHEIMVGTWSPSASDLAGARQRGFGTTINALKGKAECGHASSEAQERTKFYLEATKMLRVPSGHHLGCETMAPFE